MAFIVCILTVGGFIFCILLAFSMGAERERNRLKRLYHSDAELESAIKTAYNRGYLHGQGKASPKGSVRELEEDTDDGGMA